MKKISIDQLKEQMEAGQTPNILDVRGPVSFAEGHIPGAIHMALENLGQDWQGLDRDRVYTVICNQGDRSQLAAHFLQERGIETILVEGGMEDWTGPREQGELVDLYTKDLSRISRTHVRGQKLPEGAYPLIVKMALFNENGQVLIQQRQETKKAWPGYWDLGVGGYVHQGEKSEQAMKREMWEELGIDGTHVELRPAISIHFDQGITDFYIFQADVQIADLRLQEEEVKAVRYCSLEEIDELMTKNLFLPYNKNFLRWVFDMSQGQRMLDEGQ